MITPAFLPKALLSKPYSPSIITPAKFPQHFCPSVLTQHFCPSISRSFQQLLIFNCFKYLLQYFCQALLFFPSNFVPEFSSKKFLLQHLCSRFFAPMFWPQNFCHGSFAQGFLEVSYISNVSNVCSSIFGPTLLPQHFCPIVSAPAFLPLRFYTSIFLPLCFWKFLEVLESFMKLCEVA